MKQHIFLIPLLAILLVGCGAGRSDSSLENEAPSAAPTRDSSRSPVAVREQSISESELTKKLGSLGFQTPSEDLKAIDFSLEDLAGKESPLSAFSGKVIFLNFWATWCGPCRAEIPSMEKLYQELREEGFVIVAVNSQEPVDQVSAYVNESGMSFPVLLDSTGKVGVAYSVRAIPTTYVIDSEGWIRGRMVGTRDWYSSEIVSLVKDLLP